MGLTTSGNNSNIRVIEGITFEAIRRLHPVPHWCVKLPDGRILEPGDAGIKGESRPKLWESLEYLAMRFGKDRFIQNFGDSADA